jgi:hypothetical protein
MVALPLPQPAPKGGGSGWSIPDIDSKAVLILVVFVVAAGAILGAGIYLVVQAPVILSEAAFQVALAAGLFRTSSKIHEEGWMESVFKATRIPFVLAVASAAAFGFVALRYCPSGTTLHEVFETCVFKR